MVVVLAAVVVWVGLALVVVVAAALLVSPLLVAEVAKVDFTAALVVA